MAAVTLDLLESTTHAALVRHGCRDDIAADVARAVRVAEHNGNRICGLYYVESYCRQLESGRLPGDVDPVVHHDRPGSVRVDARFGFAQTAFRVGFGTAVDAARANGVVGYAIQHSHTCTSLGYFTEQFAQAGLIALGVTNATPRVAAPGGSARVLGTNPIAFAVPDGHGGVAFQWDFSTSAVALGKITMAQAAGESIPEAGRSMPTATRQLILMLPSRARLSPLAATRDTGSACSLRCSPPRSPAPIVRSMSRR